MPALYSHTTRSAGTVLTATIYNDDHQNHIDNGVPAQLDDYSTNVAQMQTTTDPYPASTESLATTLAGELERLRFQIAQVEQYLNGGTALTEWYYDIANPRLAHIGCRVRDASVQSIGNNAYESVDFDTEDFDTDAFHDTATNNSRITIPSGLDGKYLVWASIGFAANATGERGLKIRQDDTTDYAEDIREAPAANEAVITISTVVDLAAAEYVEVHAFQNSGAGLNTLQETNSSPEFGVAFLGV